MKEYELCVLVRRVSWLPWWIPFNTAHMHMSKRTTWQEIEHMMYEMREHFGARCAVVDPR